MEIITFLYRLFLALLLGAGIGLERQIKQRSAGLTTNALVSVGSCIFVLISVIGLNYGSGNNDAMRVVGQVVTGIGFLGAGVIMRDGFTIHGLNTAATIWCSSAVGCLAGFGLYLEATLAAVAVVGTHLALKPLSDFFDSRPLKSVEVKNIGFSLAIVANLDDELKVRRLLVDTLAKYDNVQLQKMKTTPDAEKNMVEICADILSYDNIYRTSRKLMDEMSGSRYVIEISTRKIMQRIER